MNTTGILLVGYGAIDSKIATGVAHMAFPKAIVKTASTLDDAVASPPIGDTDLLVLSRPTDSDVIRALGTLDQGGLPRWAVVSVGSNPVPLGSESILPEQWAGPVTPHAFRSAIAQHVLRRELARAQGDLLAIGVRVAHDLRTQVASILATAELSKELLMEVEPTQAALYEPIFESVDALGKIIERISFLTKVSSVASTPAKVSMKDAVTEALRRLDTKITNKNASITQPNEWPDIKGSQASLEKIWLNLIDNALTHSDDSPTRIELGWRKEKRAYCFWIRDHGKGVDAAAQSQLFSPFHLLHRTGGPRGLGLPIIQRLTELHGGRCGYTASTQGGAEFYFTLPA